MAQALLLHLDALCRRKQALYAHVCMRLLLQPLLSQKQNQRAVETVVFPIQCLPFRYSFCKDLFRSVASHTVLSCSLYSLPVPRLLDPDPGKEKRRKWGHVGKLGCSVIHQVRFSNPVQMRRIAQWTTEPLKPADPVVTLLKTLDPLWL